VGYSGGDEQIRAEKSLPVAVFDPLPAYRTGVEAMLSSRGFMVSLPSSLSDWLNKAGPKATVMTFQAPTDSAALAEMTRSEKDDPHFIIVLLDDPAPGDYAMFFRSGATSVVNRSSPPEFVSRALNDAIQGFALLPVVAIAELSAWIPVTSHRVVLEEREIAWLKALKEGRTIFEISETFGYSERTMYRYLHSTYVKLSVTNRMEAIARAAQLGLLDLE
jgi:DNA-binding NarL/FixJ family response regulator